MAQTLIWSNTNDLHNESVIIKEIAEICSKSRNKGADY